MNNMTITAKTYDEAITKALIQLQTTSDHLVVETVQEGSAGFFGIGAKQWIIRARVKSEEEEAKEAAEKAAAEKAERDRKAAEKAAAEKAAGGGLGPEQLQEPPVHPEAFIILI